MVLQYRVFCNTHSRFSNAVDMMSRSYLWPLNPSSTHHNDSGLQTLYEEVVTTLAAFIGAFGGNFIMM